MMILGGKFDIESTKSRASRSEHNLMTVTPGPVPKSNFYLRDQAGCISRTIDPRDRPWLQCRNDTKHCDCIEDPVSTGVGKVLTVRKKVVTR